MPKSDKMRSTSSRIVFGDEYKIDQDNFYVPSQSIGQVTSRHNCKYTINVKNGKSTKTSNRNDVLLGSETQLVNLEPNNNAEDSDELCGIHAHWYRFKTSNFQEINEFS